MQEKALCLADLLMASGLYAAGPWSATYDGGRRIDYVLYRGAMRSLSDHLLVGVEPEV